MRVQVPQQARQRAALAAVDSVEGRVLRDQQQFAHAARRQRRALRCTTDSAGRLRYVPRSVGMMQKAHL